MTVRIPLVSAYPGEPCRVVQIQGGRGLIRRLYALGIREGKVIRKLTTQFMRGPVVIDVGGAQVAIGFGMASKIIVEVDR